MILTCQCAFQKCRAWFHLFVDVSRSSTSRVRLKMSQPKNNGASGELEDCCRMSRAACCLAKTSAGHLLLAGTSNGRLCLF